LACIAASVVVKGQVGTVVFQRASVDLLHCLRHLKMQPLAPRRRLTADQHLPDQLRESHV
jgi:hypothetical protein